MTHPVAQTSLYQADFHAWIDQQCQLLKTGRLGDVDLENVLEELESLGRSERRALRSNLRVLLHHLLKWHYQPDKRSNSWKSTLFEHQLRLREALQDSPSLKPYLYEVFTEVYQDALKQAALETGLPLSAFPSSSPFTVEQVLETELVEVQD